MRPIALCVVAAMFAGCETVTDLISRDVETPAGALGFDADPVGGVPNGWKVDGTNQDGPMATWEIAADPTAPSAPNVLRMARENHTSEGTFNLCWTDQIQFKNGELFVRFRADGGVEDQGGGILWRARSNQDYYVCRMNPLEHNFRLYWVKDGRRKQIAGCDLDVPMGEWHVLSVTHVGTRIECSIDGEVLLATDDTTFDDAGGVGLWTKADAVTSFDDFAVVPQLSAEPQQVGYVGGK
ncbi:MAG: hypothetical protein IT459_16000 [Planctomycetes bacterium]|nr:hypothetical protein [Planctomycetota bacterium]